MHVFLIRHAIAEDHARLNGPDVMRRLTADGRGQADNLVDVVAGTKISRIISSPALRCVETIAPLAVTHRATIELDRRLAESGNPRALVAWLCELGDQPVVVCSHGEPLGSMVALLQDGALAVHDSGGGRVKKASTWVIQGDPATGLTLTYVAPPQP